MLLGKLDLRYVVRDFDCYEDIGVKVNLTSPYRDQKDRIPDRIPGTCEWFVEYELFRDWKESRSSKVLWVSADPGCGKSVLAKYLADSILAPGESRMTCYFLFKDDSEPKECYYCFVLYSTTTLFAETYSAL
ncbi:hypothetical protein GX50_00863 [[Emmonsia] crescens]|uniref:Nephrocystin 3-like N-terminal domain-containing protein n=1 Tax=[Emmonsia] crescens TaxID=73230 RepID=A0A2B7ZT40_9EURO|nr:hypothetical protein GX50_00863 [Emmonsia crescens]